jgi:hypothetical protein
MKKRGKRKPDFRRIRPTQTYSAAELAKAIGRDPATVRRWYREGMPALDDQKPPIFDGAAVKGWLKKRWALRKKSCGPNEAHCLRCREARQFSEGSKSIRKSTAKVLVITGKCAVCGTSMNKFASAASVAFFEPLNEHRSGTCAA